MPLRNWSILSRSSIGDIKFFILVYSYKFKLQSHSKYTPFDTIHVFEQFFPLCLNKSILMSFSVSAVFLMYVFILFLLFYLFFKWNKVFINICTVINDRFLHKFTFVCVWHFYSTLFKIYLLIVLLQLSHFPPSLHFILPTPSLPHSPPIVHVHGSYL